MKGWVVVPCRPDHARHIEFFEMLTKLELPAGSKVRFYPGFFAHDNRNAGTRDALADGAEWVCYVDDDQLLAPDAVLRLLAKDVDVVTCNLLAKAKPFSPYMFEDIDGGLYPVALSEPPDRLIEVDACGLGGVVVRRAVLESVGDPWFAVTDALKTDDLVFCARAKAKGHRIFCAPDVPSGHVVKGSVWPVWDGARWTTSVVINSGLEYRVGAATPTEEMARWRAEKLRARRKLQAV